MKMIFNIISARQRKDYPLTELSQNWLEKIQESGYRLTGSRRTVVEIIAASERALTPIAVYDLARAQHPGLGLVTVYRTLEKLESLGLIQRVHQPQGCQAFIAAFSGHQHLLLCSRCGKVEFFDGDNLESLIQEIGDETGFQIDSHWLQLFGLCSACRSAVAAESASYA